ncbi:MAG TPA: dTMP kinase, partial [Cystobacter sp.]
MFIDFEGIDGSGKTTLSNLLAARLSRLGYKVAHAREGGELRSPVARRIRELTRDASLLEMSPRTEFFLNLARDAQQLEEVIAPALARGEVCISDRYLYSQLALSGGGRGLPGAALEPACELASQGLWPDLVILVDVEPELARLRKRLGKSKAER